MNALNDRQKFEDTRVGYSVEDIALLRREAEAQGWVTAGTFFYHGICWLGRTVHSLLESVTWGFRARRIYAGLDSMSDTALAERGLTRADVAGHVLEIMAGMPIQRRPVQGELFAVGGRRPANADRPATKVADRRAA